MKKWTALILVLAMLLALTPTLTTAANAADAETAASFQTPAEPQDADCLIFPDTEDSFFKKTFEYDSPITLRFRMYSNGSHKEKYTVTVYDANNKKLASASDYFYKHQEYGFWYMNFIWDGAAQMVPGVYTVVAGATNIPDESYYFFIGDAPRSQNPRNLLPGTQAAERFNQSNPQSAWRKTSSEVKRVNSAEAAYYEVQLVNMYVGDLANRHARLANSFNKVPTEDQQWLFFCFHVKNLGPSAIKYYWIAYKTEFLDRNFNQAKVYDTATLTDYFHSPSSNEELPAGQENDYWIGLLVDKSIGLPYLRIPNGYQGWSYLDTDPALECAHSYGESVVTLEPGCTTQGTLSATCEICGHEEKTPIPALGHSWGDWELVTVTPAGSMVNSRTCSVCAATEKHEEGCATEDYRDTPAYGNWAHDGIDYCVTNGIMGSTSTDQLIFAPSKTLTRGQLAAILWKMEGSPKTETVAPYKDVKQGAWYSDAVNWTYENGIITGTNGGTTFELNTEVSREMFATILYRYYSAYLGLDASDRADLNQFPDVGQVHSYAKDALAWAVSAGLITGTKISNEICLNPRGTATRAQTATIFMRFCQALPE